MYVIHCIITRIRYTMDTLLRTVYIYSISKPSPAPELETALSICSVYDYTLYSVHCTLYIIHYTPNIMFIMYYQSNLRISTLVIYDHTQYTAIYLTIKLYRKVMVDHDADKLCNII